MAKVMPGRISVAIDIGTTKICVLVAQSLGYQDIEILAIGKSPSQGLRKGVVVDIVKTVQSIKSAVKEAELMAGYTIEAVTIGISGSHIQSINSQGAVPIKKGEVTATDIANVISAARAVPLPDDQQILHVLPQFFSIDNQERVIDPLGMHGVRLEAQVHIITGAIASVQNLIKCCELAGLKVNDIVLEQIASADAVLSDDERQLGVAVLDIGGGTSDFALYHCTSIRHTKVFAVAGNHFTHDIAVGLRTTLRDAERIKFQYGSALMDTTGAQQMITVESVQGDCQQEVMPEQLVAIINARAVELLTLVSQEMAHQGIQQCMPSGIVLTGGGALLQGMQELAAKICKVPVRIGQPKKEYGLPETVCNPMYATACGLLIYLMKKNNTASLGTLTGPVMARVFVRMKTWIADFF